VQKPEVFGKYLLIERVSVGGMAEVFKAMAVVISGFQKVLAIKRVLPHVAEDAEFIRMFVDEANIAGQLHHANIVQIYDLGAIGESYFIAMEYVEGRDLRAVYDRVKKTRQPIPIHMAAFVAAQMLAGLDHAHRKTDGALRPLNIVHRDVSPPNVLLSYMGDVKLIDFGIAKAAKKISKTQAGVLKGKFGYMSPEQVRGMPVDGRSDLFSVGIILHEMLAGHRLFVGESDFATLEKVRGMPIEPPGRINSGVPPELDAIVMRALERDVARRYPSASEMLHDLQRYLYAQTPVFAEANLAAWMREQFPEEMEKSRARMLEIEQLDLSLLGIDVAELQKASVRSLITPTVLAKIRPDREEPIVLPGQTTPVPARKPEPTPTPGGKRPTTSVVAAPLPPPKVETIADAEGTPVKRVSTFPTALAAALLAVLLAIAASGFVWLGQVDDKTHRLGTNGQSGSIVFQANQPDATVKEKGQVVCLTPCKIVDFPAGEHEVVFEKSGYLSDRARFKLSPAGQARVVGRLFQPGTVPAVLLVQSEPPGATVTIDGRPASSPTPAAIAGVMAGMPLAVKVTLDGFKDEIRSVTLDKEEFRTESVLLTPLSPSVRVRSEPEGAKVILDGKDTGRTTPTRLDALEAGKAYALRLAKEGFAAATVDVTAQAEKEELVDVALTSLAPKPAVPANRAESEERAPADAGYLSVFTEPRAKIYIDGRYTGQMSPTMKIKLPPGTHELKLINPEFNLHEVTTVTIKAGQTAKFSKRFTTE